MTTLLPSTGSSAVKGPYGVAGIAIAIAVAVFSLIYLGLPAAEQALLRLEVARTAIAVVPLAFVSGFIAEVMRRRDSDKVRRERTQESRRDFRTRVVDAYNDSKAVRSVLRAAGLQPMPGIGLTSDQLAVFDVQMRRLIDAQLAMELLKREARHAPFDHRDEITSHCEAIEKYLKRVIRDWEAGRPALQPGSSSTALGSWAHYQDFVADRHAERLPDSPTAAFKALAEAVGRELTIDPV